MNVVVTKNRQWITDLKESDFKLLDSGSERPITSFKGVTLNDGELFQYELTFDAAAGKKPDEFHPIEVRLNRPGLTVRTRHGYYAQP